MKKIIFAILSVICLLASLALTACNSGEELQIYVPDGAPAMSVASLIDDGKFASYKANVTISTGEDVQAKCVNGEADVAILPTNAAVKICAAGDVYSIFTVNVWGLLYVVGWENVSTLAELNGKKVSGIGMGNTGEYLFKRILDEHSVSYADGSGVTLNYVADGTEAIGYLMQNKCDFALLGEPAATNAITKAKSAGKTLYRVFDLQKQWQEVVGSDVSGYPQASVIVKKTLLEKSGFASALYDALMQNGGFLSKNVERLQDVLASAGSLLTVNYTADIVERCNLNTVKACDVKQDIRSYLAEFNGPFAGMLKDELYYEFNS